MSASVSGRRPVVAVPTYRLGLGRVSGWVAGGYALPDTYVGALRRAGLRPLLLPGGEPEAPEAALEGCDGLLLAGGGDVDPARYGVEAHRAQYGVDPERDESELELLAAARTLGLPVLAICRGLQLLNVAFGGTLHQDLPGTTHGDPVGGLSSSHGVRVERGSALAAAVGAPSVERCTSHHHQGVDRVGAGLVPVGWAEDDLVEALEPADDDGPWLVAVQWHPEATAGEDPVQQRLFDAFAGECAGRAGLALATPA